MNILRHSEEFSTALVPPLSDELEAAAQRIRSVRENLKDAAISAFQEEIDQAERRLSPITAELTYMEVSEVCMDSRRAQKTSLPTKLWRAIGLGGKPMGL